VLKTNVHLYRSSFPGQKALTELLSCVIFNKKYSTEKDRKQKITTLTLCPLSSIKKWQKGRPGSEMRGTPKGAAVLVKGPAINLGSLCCNLN